MAFHPLPQKQPTPFRPALNQQFESVSAGCTQCQTCVSECAFLTCYGDPKNIVDNYNPEDRHSPGMPFECSLCNLCTAVCPEGIKPATMFLEMRREAFTRGELDISAYRRLLNYEKRGTSKRFSWYALPDKCDTIFFPGCALSGSRSEITLKTYESLQRSIPTIGIVLDCCTKPSHDLGDVENFDAMFNEMKNYLLAQGIKTILLACPNCHEVFNEHGTEFEVRTVYEILDKEASPTAKKMTGTVTLHDPCTARFNLPAQNAVRNLLKNQGIRIEEQLHSGKTTLCCGEGGAVNCLAPELAKNWSKKRVKEADGQRIVSYCAGCTQTLGAHAETSHILDLFFEADTASTEKSRIATAPLTYFKRLKLKKHLQKNLPTAVTRERTFQTDSKSDGSLVKKIGVLILLTMTFLVVRSSTHFFFDQNSLRSLIQGYGLMAFLIGLLLIITVSLLPTASKRSKKPAAARVKISED